MGVFEAGKAEIYDLLVIGGGINGAGIAADASLRGLKVLLCEQGDLGGATSSASSKLIHGGLRYLEHYEFRLVREALAEREVLLANAPHLVRPMRFVLPHQPHLRPAWMIRSGLFLYDHLADRKTLPATRSLRFTAGSPLQPSLHKGFGYSDCWVDDARLVIANALQARRHGARVLRSTRCSDARRLPEQGVWQATLCHKDGAVSLVKARAVVNAAGPWVSQLFDSAFKTPAPAAVRLIKGSHIVVPRLHPGPEAYILQNADKRIVFVLPYEDDFSLVGTTDKEFHGDPATVSIDQDEIDYLLDIVNRHFLRQVSADDIVHSYSGVRPLMDDESSDPSAITRDYTLLLDQQQGAMPLLSVYGGKITTYRKLAEAAVDQLLPWFAGLGRSLTETMPLPGASRPLTDQRAIFDTLSGLYPQMDVALLHRYSRSYGLLAGQIIGAASTPAGLGEHFGGQLYEREVRYLIEQEWAETVDDVLWRRTKQGLRLTTGQRQRLAEWMAINSPGAAPWQVREQERFAVGE